MSPLALRPMTLVNRTGLMLVMTVKASGSLGGSVGVVCSLSPLFGSAQLRELSGVARFEVPTVWPTWAISTGVTVPEGAPFELFFVASTSLGLFVPVNPAGVVELRFRALDSASLWGLAFSITRLPVGV